MISTEDTKVTKPNKYTNKLHGMQKYTRKKYSESLVVLRKHYRADVPPIIANAHEPKYNFLKYWKVVRKWATVKYDMTLSDVEVMLFLYDEGIWKKKDFLNATSIHSWEKGRLERFIRRGWIRVFREGKGYKGHARLYEMTPAAKRICRSIYLKVTQEEAIPENIQNNPIFKKTDETYILKVYRSAIKRMNAQRSAKRLAEGSYDE